ncbi:UDP-3-O-acylglucosamine N-acyltransferase [Bacteroidales bacterium Barb6]|nr:UDP-3-O-acylglucosamine N-acyltransferase [Bacteroidales bacterium Barb6]
MEFSARQIADFLKGTVCGNPEITVNTFSKIEEGKPDSITFLANPKYEHYIYDTEADIVLVNADFVPAKPVKATLIKVDNAYAALAMLMTMVEQAKPCKTGIDPMTFIAASAQTGDNLYIGTYSYVGENTRIGSNCKIYPHAYIGDNVTVGDNTVVYPHVTVYSNCRIGERCVIHAGAVIGSDGFGFAPEGDIYSKIPQIGNVVIEDDVEIGANTAIDRAVMGSTVIHKGVKLDNLIQIGHNVEVGEHTVMAAQGGIAGSVKVGRHCQFGGQAGLAGHIYIGNNVSVGAQAGLMSDVKEDNATLLGSPAFNARGYMRSAAVFNRLPDMYRTLGELQREIEQLKKAINK